MVVGRMRRSIACVDERKIASIPSAAAPSARSWSTLLPSPTHASFLPASDRDAPPIVSCSVSRSASACSGWCRSDNALITGTLACAASSVTSAWPNTRASTIELKRESTSAVSCGVSSRCRRALLLGGCAEGRRAFLIAAAARARERASERAHRHSAIRAKKVAAAAACAPRRGGDSEGASGSSRDIVARPILPSVGLP